MDSENAEQLIFDIEAHNDENEEKLEAANDVAMISSRSLDKLSTGFVELYVEDLKSITNPLNELNRNQEVLIETILHENARFGEAKQSVNLDEMFNRLAQYQTKLVSIKKDMLALHEKAVKLKKRSLKLQTLKEKESGQKETTKLSR